MAPAPLHPNSPGRVLHLPCSNLDAHSLALQSSCETALGLSPPSETISCRSPSRRLAENKAACRVTWPVVVAALPCAIFFGASSLAMRNLAACPTPPACSKHEASKRRRRWEQGRGFVQADQIDLKSLDEQLERHLSRQERDAPAPAQPGSRRSRSARLGSRSRHRRSAAPRDWEVDPPSSSSKASLPRAPSAPSTAASTTARTLPIRTRNYRTKISITQEVAVWHKLDHPNVTKFIGAIMGARDLNVQTEHGHLGMPTLDLARGLSYLHSEKIVHRDVKTENMLLDKTRTVKIADFGVARVEASNPSDMTGETGTLGYMAPEVLNGHPYNRKCDVYSFGICLWRYTAATCVS
ncbi:hypothetical protein ZWY2020_003926 [Hordeum vulgare]|nr:hypothetical protein ZWY2020_003926 [Hordeum vulgare]